MKSFKKDYYEKVFGLIPETNETVKEETCPKCKGSGKVLIHPKQMTPQEKSQRALEMIEAMQELNRKICEIGACIHKEHQKN